LRQVKADTRRADYFWVTRTTEEAMNSDHQLQKRVLEELDFDPEIESSHIGVAVRDHIVTLSGHVPSFAEKRAAEIVAGRVAGVRAVIVDLTVEQPGRVQTPDEVTVEYCCRALAEDPTIELDRIHIGVKDGTVTIHGDVDQDYQRKIISDHLTGLPGVQAITDELVVRPAVRAEVVLRKVRQALEPISVINAEKIEVKTTGTHVVLKGAVNSWHERGMAESAVWSVPGVTSLDDQLVVL
jgi:osmotically-inducible protein OsmY